MNATLRILIGLAAMAAFAGPASAKTDKTPTADVWTSVATTTSPIQVSYSTGNSGNTGIATVTYSAFSAAAVSANTIWAYDGNITPQNAASILAIVDTQFGLKSGDLKLAASCDTTPGSCFNGDSTGGDAIKASNTFTSNTSFDYLAVH